jgi:hypothetical protein
LARCADGLDAFARFVNSYKNHPAGIDHKLVIIYKGFESSESLEQAKLIFKDVLHDQIFLEDVGFDIGSYFEASKVITSEYLCFLNTHSEISADDWLKLMMQAATKDEIGLTGAMGSYESIKDSVNLYRWIILESMGANLEIKKFIAIYFEYILSRYHRKWYLGNIFDEIEMEQDNRLKRLVLFLRKIVFLPGFYSSGTQSIWLSAPKFESNIFPSFPNPHIRSNGFIMKGQIFRGLLTRNLINKAEANLFESGPQSMTNVIKNLGLKVVIVGKNGTIYDEENWWDSHTFRQGDQSNLLISDNHTRAFMDMSEPSRESHEWLTWGVSKKTKRPTIFDYKYKI